jgi:hypothetical protein
MARLLELKRYWRDVRSLSDVRGSNYTHLWSDEDDVNFLARFGLYHLGSLAKHECLVLLGRPGAGKSSEVERIASGQVQGFADEYCVLVSCKEIDADVDREIIRIPEWRSAGQQFKTVRLILDALDEGYLRDARYFTALKLGLKNLRSQHADLRLLLVCRPAEWDETFGKAVHDLWDGIEEPKAYTLEPLSADNQRALVESWGISAPTEMLQWVHLNKFEEFAAWPRSLKWLAEQFDTGETERMTYTELCRRRAMRSFSEEDKRIEEAGRGERVEVWGHALMLMAATVLFCGRKGLALEGSDPAYLTLDEMFQSGTPLSMPKRPLLTRLDVREAIRTSDLLEAHGGYHRFQNQSDLEFLAAAMLVSLDLEQLSELFGCADDAGHWRVFPQLATTAANLATQSREFFDWLLRHDPRVLMRVDFASKSTEDKAAAIHAMFAATLAANATAVHDEQALFATLRNPQIEEQVGPWLYDQSSTLAVRQLAFDIALACCSTAFWLNFDKVVSQGQDDFLQSRLPSIILRFGRDWPQDRLKAMAALPDDRLAGPAMRALLDQGFKPGGLAPFLREPAGGTITSYDVLLSRQLPRECSIDDVPPLLAKIANWSTVGAHTGETRTLAEALIAKAVAALDREDIRLALTNFVAARFRDDDWFFDGIDARSLARLGFDNAEHRRDFLLLLANASFGEAPEMQQMTFNLPLLTDDYFWLLEQLIITEGRAALVLARLASGVVSQLGDEYAEAVDRAYDASRELRAIFPSITGSSFFAQLRLWRVEAEEQRRIRGEEFRRKIADRPYSHEEHLVHALNTCRGGHLEWWTDVCYALSQPGSMHDYTNFVRGSDIRSLPGWQAASSVLREELTQFARGFLLQEMTPEPPARQIPEAFFGITYALSLHAARLGTDAELRAAARPLWLQALLRQSGLDSQTAADCIAALTDAVPTVAATGYERELRTIWDRDEPIYSELLSAIWSPQLECALTRVLEGSPVQPKCYESGLDLLLHHDPAHATHLARRRLLEHAALPDSPARRATIAVCLFTINSLWQDAWSSFVGDSAAARQLVIEHPHLLETPKDNDLIAAMPTPFITALYKVMLDVFPLNKAPQREGVRFLGPEDQAYNLQTALREALEKRGEYKELKAALDLYPDLQQAWWVGRSLERAKMNAHALRQVPPTAVEFILFLGTEGGTFVRDNDTLQNAIMASLRRFEEQLHPLVITSLWEDMEPRSEGSLQIEVTRHLKSDFEDKEIVVNMEVKVEGKQGVDILVEAPPYCVTIEVKQAHGTDKHRPVLESMRLQLRDTYLAISRGTHGIYIVGWYFCPAFRPGGLRNIRTIEAARTYFALQAADLSTGDFSIASAVLDCGWKDSITARAKRAKVSKPESSMG